jgi:hypothetical protein
MNCKIHNDVKSLPQYVPSIGELVMYGTSLDTPTVVHVLDIGMNYVKGIIYETDGTVRYADKIYIANIYGSFKGSITIKNELPNHN